MSNLLDNVVLVLYQPQDVVNVGGVIRVMSNFGLRRLRLVEPAAWDAYRVEGIAHHTRPIIDSVEFYPTLEAAISDCGFVLGTTARKRGTRREKLTPRQAAPLVLEAARKSSETPAAILFGREDSGLPNEALEDCHALVTISTAPENSSLNLAQATLLLVYELWNASQASAHPETTQTLPAQPVGIPPRTGEQLSVEQAVQLLQEDSRLANGTEREVMFKALADLLWALYPDTTETRVTYSMTRLRAVLLRAAPRHDEAGALTHLFRHLTRVARPVNSEEAKKSKEEAG